MIAIHNNLRNSSFQSRWVNYCKANGIPYKLVNSFSNDIVEELEGSDIFMWHFHQYDVKDILMAKPLLYAIEQSGIKVFPDYKTAWHFDDKVGQKYLLEALGIDMVKTYVFYDQKIVLDWIQKTTFPKVFKLRGGAGSQNVQLVHNATQAKKLTRKAFGNGFPAYDAWESIRERYRKWRLGKTNFFDVLKGLVRLIKPPSYARVIGNEMNYLYFQEFIANNDSDIRIVVIDGKAFAIKRMNRENDFRASGSGFIIYDKAAIDERFVKVSFEYQRKLKAQCLAYDYILDANNQPLLIEISYGFANAGYDDCPGYWDEQMHWYEGEFNPYGWMVELMLNDGK
jgi:glutathione synthase/RimK-type ligase-like ATP-grasp enzyme